MQVMDIEFGEPNGLSDLNSLPALDTLQAVFFDFDDALAQSLDIKAEAFMSLFTEVDAQRRAQIHAYFLHHTGRARRTKLQHIYAEILQQPLADETMEQLCQLFTDRSMEAVIRSPEVEGADALLRVLQARGIRLFVVSGTPETELQHIIGARGMAGYFAGVRGTPVEKEINIAELLNTHQLDAACCLMVGDGRVDYVAAVHNLMPFVGVVKGENPFPPGIAVVTNLTQLPPLLNPSAAPD